MDDNNQPSQAQIDANRQNAVLGGVKTEEGKEVSKMNAVKHGILVRFMSDEERNEAESIKNSLIVDFKPDSTIEHILIERIAIWYIRMQRVIKAETEQIKKIENPRIERREGGFDLEKHVLLQGKLIVESEGYQPKVSEENIDLFEKTYTRYETAVERNFYKALHELQRIQAGKRGENVAPPIAVDVSIDRTDETVIT